MISSPGIRPARADRNQRWLPSPCDVSDGTSGGPRLESAGLTAGSSIDREKNGGGDDGEKI